MAQDLPNFLINKFQYIISPTLWFIYIKIFMKRFLLLSLILALTIGLAHSYSLPKCETGNCQVCSSLGVCVMCHDNYMLTINKETKTSQCIQKTCKIEKCSRCLSEKICAQCETGFVLHSSGSCTKINEKIHIVQKSVESCLKRSLLGQCLECATDFVLEDGECQFKKVSLVSLANTVGVTVTCSSALNNCGSCTVSPNYCSSCLTGYSLSTSGSCVSCQVSGGGSIPNCQACTVSNICSVCSAGYTLYTPPSGVTSCYQCNIPGCISCSNTNYCASCAMGYALNSLNTACVLTNCPYQCATCSASGQCLTCNPPFNTTATANGTCFTCAIPNCLTCNTLGCIQCASPWTVSTSGTCVFPTYSPLCVTAGATAGTCATCVSGYSPNTNGVCTACTGSPICTACTITSTGQTCGACVTGYYLNANNACTACSYGTCSVGQCSSSGVCQSWAQSTGYLTYTTTTTTPTSYFPYTCDNGCAQCSSIYPTACYQCSAGYVLVSTAATNNIPMCQPCVGNCLTCSPTNTSYCYSCLTTTYLSTTSNTCLPCGAGLNCLTCNPSFPSTACYTCPYGYYLQTTTVNKVTTTNCNSPCPGNCQSCTLVTGTTVTCTQCEQGFSLSLTGSCLPCLSNCQVCSGQFNSICLQCGSGYYINANLTCSQCPYNCSTCTPLGCTACNAGLNLMTYNGNTVCAPACSFPCASCSISNPYACTSCIFGYTLSNSQTCTLSTCVTGTGSGCQNCPPGSVLINGACTACQNGCGRCSPSNTKICVGCLSGQYLSSSSCVACPSPCATCSGPSNCLSCMSGYTAVATPIYSNQIICQACVAPCAQCSGNVEQCTSCISGFTFTGWNCVSNFYYTFTASFAASQTFFFTHYQGLINQLTYALQTTNNKALSIQQISSTPATTDFIVYMTTIEQSDSAKSAAEYNNLKFALLQEEGDDLAGMHVTTSKLGFVGGQVYNTYSSTPTYCGIFIPLGLLIFVAIGYFICSAKDMDLPGSNYIPPDAPASEREATELKSL